MTISLKEHVARAIEGCTSHNLPKTTFDNMARAAIAAVREYEGDAEEVSMSMFVSSAEKRRYEMGMKDKANRIRESERAACEAIAHGFSLEANQGRNRLKVSPTWADDQTPSDVYNLGADDASTFIAADIAARAGKGDVTLATGSHSPPIPRDSDSKRP
jgi:hypothetical protein